MRIFNYNFTQILESQDIPPPRISSPVHATVDLPYMHLRAFIQMTKSSDIWFKFPAPLIVYISNPAKSPVVGGWYPGINLTYTQIAANNSLRVSVCIHSVCFNEEFPKIKNYRIEFDIM